MKNEYPDSEVQANGTERHTGCGGEILYFKEGWICSKCKESGPDEDDEEITLTEKISTAIEAIALITWLIRPGNRTAEIIREHEENVRELIRKVTEAPPET